MLFWLSSSTDVCTGQTGALLKGLLALHVAGKKTGAVFFFSRSPLPILTQQHCESTDAFQILLFSLEWSSLQRKTILFG